MHSADSTRVRPLAGADLELVLAWRNHPAVRRSMLTQNEITWEEHQAWYERACADPKRRLLIAQDDTGPIGYVGISGVAEGGIADWGFYAAPGAPRGAGRRLGRAALEFAFGELRLHKVCGQALASNEPSIRMHLALGFTREGVLREQHRAHDTYHDLHCFGLLRHEWMPSSGIEGNRT